MANAGSKKQHTEQCDDDGNCNSCPFLSLARLILPWLTPQELAAISCTCKTLNQISKSITVARSSDACRSLENVAIPFVNTVDSHPYSYFLYAPSKSTSRQFWGDRPTIKVRNPSETKYYLPDDSIASDSSGGCNCGDKCVVSLEEEDDDHQCPCSTLRLRGGGEVVTECGPSCRCGPNCGNRSTQKGLSVKLKVVRDKKKGWGLFADQLIGRGEFVCEYVGELVTTQEARRRQKEYDELRTEGEDEGVGAGKKKKKLFSSALLVVREHLPSGKACFRINIDATRIGNVARFINHSCDGGNLSSVLVRVSGCLMPRVCFFASRDISEGEELCFSYGDISCLGANSQGGLSLNYCCCGSHCCYGVLPSENT